MINIHELPLGYVFCPTEEELVVSYLLPKVTNNPLPVDDLIQEHDLYSDQHPWQIFGVPQGKKDDYYVFTPLKKSTPNASRFIRNVGCNGTWKLQSSRRVTDHEGRDVGERKSFSYMLKSDENKKKNKNGRWVMKEFSLEGGVYSGFALPGFQDYALCRITNYMDDQNDDFASSLFQESDEVPIQPQKPYLDSGDYYVSSNTPGALSVEASCSSNSTIPLALATEPQLPHIENFDQEAIQPRKLYVDNGTCYVSNIMPKELSIEANCSSNFTIPLAVASDEQQLPDGDDVFSISDLLELEAYVPCQLTNHIGGSSISQESQSSVVATLPLPKMDQVLIQPQERYTDDFFGDLGDITFLPSHSDGNINYFSIIKNQILGIINPT